MENHFVTGDVVKATNRQEPFALFLIVVNAESPDSFPYFGGVVLLDKLPEGHIYNKGEISYVWKKNEFVLSSLEEMIPYLDSQKLVQASNFTS